MCFGSALGWSSPAFRHSFRHERQYLRLYNMSWTISLVPIGICIGVIFWSYLNMKIGPRKSMLIQSPFLTITWLILGIKTTPKLYMASRFFCGFLSVSYLICGETLILESVHQGYIKLMLVIFNSSIFLGILLMNLAGQVIPKWYFSFIPPSIVSVQTFLLFFCPESPAFLFEKNEVAAENALRWLRGNININIELRNIKKDAEYRKVDPDAHKYMMYSKVVVKGVLIVVGLCFFQVFSGYYAFVFFNLKIWDDYGESSISQFIDNLIYCIWMYTMNILFTLLHYRTPFGVRIPLILSSLVMAINLIFIMLYCVFYDYDFTITDYLEWYPIVAVCVNILGYEMGYASLPDIILYDYMPYQVYPRCKMVVFSLRWFFVFLLAKTFMYTSEMISFTYSFLLCAVLQTIGCLYTYFFVIETKDKTLVQIQIDIGGNPVGNRGSYKRRKDRL